MTMRLALLLGILCVAAVFGQEGSAPPAETAPMLDADDRLMLKGLVALATTANADCQELATMKQYQEHRRELLARWERKYVGYSLNLSTGMLEKKGKS